jgi:hypothetical protein
MQKRQRPDCIFSRTNLELRSEFFNIFNHPQYGLPQATFGVPDFGSITRITVGGTAL